MPMTRENGRVKIDISEDDFDLLNFAIGTVHGTAASRNQPALVARLLRLVNTINEGNGAFVPLEVVDVPAETAAPGFASPAS